jgi:hypothetical protein
MTAGIKISVFLTHFVSLKKENVNWKGKLKNDLILAGSGAIHMRKWALKPIFVSR